MEKKGYTIIVRDHEKGSENTVEASGFVLVHQDAHNDTRIGVCRVFKGLEVFQVAGILSALNEMVKESPFASIIDKLGALQKEKEEKEPSVEEFMEFLKMMGDRL